MKRGTGFTLIEVLIVLAIVAVLAAVAYPSYAGYVTKTRRVEGQIALIEAMQQQERFYSQSNTYAAFAPASGDAQAKHIKWWSGSVAANSAYELRGQACPGSLLSQCIELQATPGTSNVDPTFRDADCGTLTLNSAGEHSSSGPAEHCWQ